MDNARLGFKPLEIVPRHDEDFERTVKRFTRKVRADGILREIYERQSYNKPSVADRQKRSKARFSAMKRIAEV